ncbi:hypothetical protein [Phaeocystidibacter marisrubri]|uniref:Uncharacterized protein n=1 Tax=Phaeocystidibacter marisrubri TaxID=1577780 RepID=A0A6L3ZCL4_9FLAO|nr:hypothetical protein [Phaeocystidibacter marisrubri]KAB2815585.1 hypothetical protein F8C82_07735 [Phaeocystidibacter marisrubri]GGH64657.1 hypothetical protein GCM10011318_00890 [Phaeocystidibacter marisrubri]
MLKGRKRTITRRITSDSELKLDAVLQYQFFNQGTAEVFIGDGSLNQAPMLTNLQSREGLTLGNPTLTESIHKAIRFGEVGTKDLIVYLEVFHPETEESGEKIC